MRQVDQEELIWKLQFRLNRLPASMRNALASRLPEQRRYAERAIAEDLANAGLARLEILSDAPPPPTVMTGRVSDALREEERLA